MATRDDHPDPTAQTIDAPASGASPLIPIRPTDETVDRDRADKTAPLPLDPESGSSSKTLPVHSRNVAPAEIEATFVSTAQANPEQTLVGVASGDDSTPSDATREGSDGDAPSLTPGEPFRPGMTLAKYTLVRLLGQGAFGAVYLGYDKQLDRDVAVKVAKTGFLVHRQDVNRFLREARSAAQLRHPQIVPVHEFGEFRGTNYIAYEYIKGQTLKNLLVARDKLTPEEAARMTAKLARALHYAHTCNIVHRDMKPDNVLLDEHGEPHIADFGLARRDDSGDGRTLEGALMGTPAYMSPEQASGQSATADGRSDVWSLGVMLEEMLTSVRPFEGSVTEILVAVRQQEPKALRQINKALPADLETIVAKCLAKKREERFLTAEALAEELERWLRGEPILSRPLSHAERLVRWAKRNPQIAALTGGIAATLLLGICFSSYFAVAANHQANLLRQEQRERALGRLLTLQSAAPESLEQILTALTPDASLVLPRIREVLSESAVTTSTGQDRLRVALAVLDPQGSDLDTHLSLISDHLLAAAPAEFAAQVTALESSADRLARGFWSVIENSTEQPERRLRAACALAAWQQDSERWRHFSSDVAAMLTTQSSLDLPAWLATVAEVRDDLLKPLQNLFQERGHASQSEAAAAILSRLFADQPRPLIGLVDRASPEQLGHLLTSFRQRPELLTEFTSRLHSEKSALERSYDQRTETAQTQSNLLLVLLALNRSDLFRGEFLRLDSPDLQTEIMHTADAAGFDPRAFAALLRPDMEPPLLRLACLTLAGFSQGLLTPTERDRWVTTLLDLHSNHPDPGVHGASRWLLQEWKRFPDQILIADATANASTAKNWLEDRWVGTMTRVTGPVTFAMGSRTDEPYHSPFELRHQREIPRSFAVATREVTVAEFLKFRKDHAYNREIAPDLQCPINDVTWHDAIAYCRWLSEQAGIEESQMCFPSVDQIGPTYQLPADILSRTGYRLPTAAEWECVCRAGYDSSRSNGESEVYQGRFAWYVRNSERHTWPVGQLKPNPLGLFDMHGNALEWCLTWYFEQPPKPDERGIVVDAIESRRGIYRELRGGGYDIKIDQLRTADRDFSPPMDNSYYYGFRVARSLAPDPAVRPIPGTP